MQVELADNQRRSVSGDGNSNRETERFGRLVSLFDSPRIGFQYHLSGMSREETSAYAKHHKEEAKLARPVFAESAVQGKGIPPEHQAHVFERFYRVDSGRKGEGLEIGLAIVKDIAEAHRGSIEINSTPNVATVFRIRLPR